jgi:MFS family permease
MLYATSPGSSASRMGALFVAEIAPTFLSPILGVLGDRVDRRRLFVAGELLQGAVMIALSLRVPAFPVLLVLALLRALTQTTVKPAITSAIPGFVEEVGLEQANAWVRGGEEGAAIVGPMVAGVVAPMVGLRGLFAVDALTFLLAAGALFGLPPLAPADRERRGDGVVGEALAGLRAVVENGTARALAVGLFVFVLFAALENVPRPFLATRDLGAGAFGIGLLWAMPQLGMVAGLFAVGRMGRARSGALLVAGMAAYGAGALITCAAPNLALAAFGQLVAGVGNGLEVGCADVLLQRNVPKDVMGRVFANVYGAASVAAGVAYAIGGPMLDWTSPRSMFAVVAAGCIFAAVLTAALLSSSGGVQ